MSRPPSTRRLTGARKLLVASLGVAGIHYGAGCDTSTSNDPPPTSGNLIAPPFVEPDRPRPPFVPAPSTDAGALHDAALDAGDDDAGGNDDVD
jgi:hypothetical protein